VDGHGIHNLGDSSRRRGYGITEKSSTMNQAFLLSRSNIKVLVFLLAEGYLLLFVPYSPSLMVGPREYLDMRLFGYGFPYKSKANLPIKMSVGRSSKCITLYSPSSSSFSRDHFSRCILHRASLLSIMRGDITLASYFSEVR